MSQKPKAFKNYVKQLRQCDINLRLADRQHEHKHDENHVGHRQKYDDYNTDSSYSNKTSKTNRNELKEYYETNIHSKETLKQLRQQDKCFRCQKTDHIIMDENASCRGKKEKTVEKG